MKSFRKATRLIIPAFLLMLCLFMAFPKSMNANAFHDLIREANMEYSSGYYDHALELYMTVVDLGYASPELYYNIGNTLYKLNRIPEAILNYERALRLAPRDENIQFNLALAQTRIIDRIDSIPELFYEKWLRSLLNLFSADGWGRFSIVLLFISLSLAVLFLLSVRRWARVLSFYTAVFLFALSLTALVFAFVQQHHRTGKPEAIVFDPSVTVKSSPSEASIDLFVIHEGTKVRITEQVGDWYEIRLTSGSMGWLKSESVERI